MRIVCRILGIVVLCIANAASAQPREILVYTGGGGAGIVDRVRPWADRIDILAPQAFAAGADGRLRGAVSPELLAAAKEWDIDVIPLVVNPGFNQDTLRVMLEHPEARRRSIDDMVRLGREHGFAGWQFDYENLHVSLRDAFTGYYRETAEALHANGMTLSAAVVPTDGSPGVSPFARYMQDWWRNPYDLAALDSIGDFLSYMTYAQHGGVTAPGPIAGLPWMRRMVTYALETGVRPERVSLGLPFYSGWWAPGYVEHTGTARVFGHEIGWQRAQELLTESGAPLTWDAEQGASFARWESEGTMQWLFLEDARSMAAKLDLLRTWPGFRGVSIWVLGAEDPAMWDALRPPGSEGRGQRTR